MSYLLGGESVQSRQDTLQDISESSFNQEDEAYKNRLDETLSNALTPARIATRSIANLGIAADAIPTALGTYYGIDNPGWHKHVTQSLIHTRDALTPDPQTTHVSLQIADQFAGMLGDVAVTLGNPVAFSAMQGGKRVTEELEKGKGLGTSLKLGAVDALAAKAYMTVPLGFASKALPIATRLQGAITGAGIGAGIGSASEIANESVLKADGYPEEAKQHDWSNPTTLALNAAFGAVFGGIHPRVLPSHQAAVLTAMDAHAIENPDSLSATNPASNNALVDGMNQSVKELVDGVPITSSIRDTESFAYDPAKGQIEQQIASHIADQHLENNQKAVDSFKEDYPDIVNGIVDDHYKTLLSSKSEGAGWSQKGGELLRDIEGNAGGRTTWLPHQEWFGRFVSEGIGNKKELQRAVEKFNSGEKLGPKQSTIVDWLKNEVDGKHQEGNPDGFNTTNGHEDLNNRIIQHIESIQEQRKQVASDKSGQFIHDDIVRQLEEAGHHDAEKNSAYARLQQVVMTNQAREVGMSPREFYERHGNTKVLKGESEDLSGAFGQVLPNALINGMEIGDANKLAAMYRKEDKTKSVLLGQADSRLIEDGLKENAYLGTFSHSADQSALNHIRKNHTDEASEANRGQLPVTDADIAKITDIIKDYDGIRFDLLSSYGKPVIAYVKKLKDGVFLYTEEVHNKRHDLAALSLRKYPATANVLKILKNVGPNVLNDGGHSNSIGKPPKASKPFDGSEEAKTAIKEGETNIDVDGVKRQTLNSNGNPIHTTEEGMRNFWRWFGDSKVVDNKGRPLVVYHGTDKAFSTINIRKGAQNLFWFTSDKASIENGEVGANGQGKIMELYIKLDKPANWDQYDQLSTGEFKGRGLDGAILDKGTKDFDGFVLEGNQVKSANGKNAEFGNNNKILHQENRGSFDPATNTINLFKSADATTFLHESGHQFLELYHNMIEMGDATPVIKADFDKLLNWFGVKDHAEWSNMTLDQQRPYHEKFAKGFETYLSEGKAPTPELQGIFKNFAQWIKQVYSDVKGKLGVKLTDDVRGVMDRIINHGESQAMKSDTPEITSAREAIPSIESARQFEIEHDDGTTDKGSASELMARADEEAAFAEQSDTATSAAISCFLKFGDL